MEMSLPEAASIARSFSLGMVIGAPGGHGQIVPNIHTCVAPGYELKGIKVVVMTQR